MESYRYALRSQFYERISPPVHTNTQFRFVYNKSQTYYSDLSYKNELKTYFNLLFHQQIHLEVVCRSNHQIENTKF